MKKINAICELLCVFFWFLLDGFWLYENKELTIVTSVLSIVFFFGMFATLPSNLSMILIALADGCWLTCNITWARGDLYHETFVLGEAKITFLIGCGFWLASIITAQEKNLLSAFVLSRLRVIQFFKKDKSC